MNDMQSRRGFTLMELLVVIAILMLLIGLLLPALARGRRNSQSTKDGTQQKEIHRTLLTWANNHDGLLPIPGQVNRLPVGAAELPGQGPEDFTRNTSQNLYSALIAQDYLETDVLVGPTEVNPIVVEDLDYDRSVYSPADDSYWDPGFSMDIAGVAGQDECNASFAHEAICGRRKGRRWRDTQDTTYPILGTRGVEGGLPPDNEDYDKSPTLRLHGQKKVWVGNIVFADNHVERLANFYPVQTKYEPSDGSAQRDNIFDYEFPDGQADADAWLVVSTGADDDGTGVTEEFDRLVN
jgi:prepilin-type N-terminal cleavage/methylation domain-containing protein/prepilin-type processing-associated H-X9-DG protein